MVGLVNQDDIGITKGALQMAREAAFALKVGVIVGNEGDESAVEIRQEELNGRSPDIFARCFRREQHNAFAFMHHHALDDHEADVGLAETDAIAKECTPVEPGDLDKVLVGVLLVAGQLREDDGALTVPFIGSQFVTAQQFMKRLEPYLKRRARIRVALEGAEHFGGDIL